MGEEIRWAATEAAYIRSRPRRYPEGLGVEPEWVDEVMNDDDLLALEPDPKSRMGRLDSSATPPPPTGS